MNKTLKDTLVGVLLGDAHIERTGSDKAFISFEQSSKKLDYVKHLHNSVQEGGLPLTNDNLKEYSRNDRRYGTINKSLYFRTKSLVELKPIADLFLNKEGKKIIPLNIADHLTIKSLAFSGFKVLGRLFQKNSLVRTLDNRRYYHSSTNLCLSKLDTNLPEINPVKSYPIVGKDKNLIYKDNKHKSGIYLWTNLEDNKRYVGSSVNLSKRFTVYFSIKNLSEAKESSHFKRALLKYGLNKFKLVILEYCEKTILIKREQSYIDLLKPEYNILKTAGSSLGYKHTKETIAKFKSRKDLTSPEHLERLRVYRLQNNTEEQREAARVRMLRINEAKGIKVEITDLETKTTVTYNSIRKAAEAIGCAKNALICNEKQSLIKTEIKPIKGRYLVKIIRES